MPADDGILSSMGIEERLGEDPLIRLPPPPRPCSDFIVKEIHGPGLQPTLKSSPSTPFPLYRLVKEGIDTPTALRRLGRLTGLRSWGFSGLKDARALTVQLVTGPASSASVPMRACFEGGLVVLLGWVPHGLSRGSHVANFFAVNTRSREGGEAGFRRVFPNYFGPQRFGGSRPLSHEMGFALVRGGVEELYQVVERKRRAGGWEGRFTRLYEERPRDCSTRPLWCVGRHVARILVDAVRSYVFNRCLSSVVPRWRRELSGRPGAWFGVLWGVGGYNAVASHGRVLSDHVECTKSLVRELGLNSIGRPIARLVGKRGLRPLSLTAEGLRMCMKGDGLRIFFRLPPSAYASSFLFENAMGVVGWFLGDCVRSRFWERVGECSAGGEATRAGLSRGPARSR